MKTLKLCKTFLEYAKQLDSVSDESCQSRDYSNPYFHLNVDKFYILMNNYPGGIEDKPREQIMYLALLLHYSKSTDKYKTSNPLCKNSDLI